MRDFYSVLGGGHNDTWEAGGRDYYEVGEHTHTRRIKREIFKFGTIQLVCGIALFVIAYQEDRNFFLSQYFIQNNYGSNLQSLMWLCAFGGVIMGVISMVMIRYWSSLVTNRELLSSILKLYMFIFFIFFIFVLWTTCVVFLTFSGVKRWSANEDLKAIYPYYIATGVFITPFTCAICMYTLNISYLNEELELGGDIMEPDMHLMRSVFICMLFCAFVCVLDAN